MAKHKENSKKISNPQKFIICHTVALSIIIIKVILTKTHLSSADQAVTMYVKPPCYFKSPKKMQIMPYLEVASCMKSTTVLPQSTIKTSVLLQKYFLVQL